MKLQILCMTCETDMNLLKKLVKNWTQKVDRVVLYANGDKRDLIKKTFKRWKSVIVFIGDFLGFSETRNKLINLAKNGDYDYSIMLDDSYFIQGNFNELMFLNYNQLYIGVYNGKGSMTPRRLIFKTGGYSGKIHETLDVEGAQGRVFLVYLKDIQYDSHITRSYKRANYDLEQLKDDNTRRGKYYKAMTMTKKYLYERQSGVIPKDNDKATKLFQELLDEKVNDYIDASIKYFFNISN